MLQKSHGLCRQAHDLVDNTRAMWEGIAAAICPDGACNFHFIAMGPRSTGSSALTTAYTTARTQTTGTVPPTPNRLSVLKNNPTATTARAGGKNYAGKTREG